MPEKVGQIDFMFFFLSVRKELVGGKTPKPANVGHVRMHFALSEHETRWIGLRMCRCVECVDPCVGLDVTWGRLMSIGGG